jgi:hypothetical protein
MGKHRIDDGRQCNSCDEKEGGRTRRMVEGATATGRGWKATSARPVKGPRVTTVRDQ